MRKILTIVVTLLIAVLLVLGACAPATTPAPTPAPSSSPISTPVPTLTPAPSREDTSGHIYSNGGIECGGDGEPIVLINSPNANNPTYSKLVAFIVEDTTNTKDYVKGGPEAHVCADFAEELHNNAEAAGIGAAWVGVEFEGDIEGHALDAFETTDKGLVYIDCTGNLMKIWLGDSYIPNIESVTFESWLYEESIPDSAKLTEWDTVASVEVGKEYGLIGIDEAKSLEYETKLEAYNREVERYNQEISGEVYIEGSTELARIEAWEAELDRQEQKLDSLQQELGYYRYEVQDSSGIVKDIYIHW